MRLVPLAVSLALCAGCFTSGKPTPKSWTVEPRESGAGTKTSAEGNGSAFVATRVGTIAVLPRAAVLHSWLRGSARLP